MNEQDDKYPAQDGMAMSMLDAPTRGEATLRDLRRYAAAIINDRDRELVQHSADMLEVAFKSAPSESAFPMDKIVSVTRAFDYLGKNINEPWVKVCFANDDWKARDAFADSLKNPAPQPQVGAEKEGEPRLPAESGPFNTLPGPVQETINAHARYYAEHHKLGMSLKDDMTYIACVAMRWAELEKK